MPRRALANDVRLDSSYRLSEDVYLDHRTNDIAVIMDLRRGKFFALDAIAVDYLQRLIKHGVESTCRQMSENFGTPVERIRRDLKELIKYLLEQRLIVPLPNSHRREPKCNAINRARLLLIWIWLRTIGWSRTLSLVQFLARRAQTDSNSLATTFVEQADQVACQLVQRSWLNAACKERAILCWWLLAERSVQSEIVVGYRTDPFVAHAWVRAHGRTLTDLDANCRHFNVLARFPGQCRPDEESNHNIYMTREG